MRFYSSLAFKNAILYLFIFLVAIGVLGYLLLSYSARRIVQNAEDQLAFNGELIEIQLNEYINDLVNNIDFLSTGPVLEEWLDNKSSANSSRVKQEFQSLINSYDDFSQVRILDAENGMEMVRVEKQDEKSLIVSDSVLQNKSDRAYFQAALELQADEMYFSSIDLNKEFGEISQPYTPTLRLSRAIYIGDDLKAVLVINTDLTKLFDRLEKLVGNSFVLRMLNSDGYYVMHEVPDSTFRFEFGQKEPQISTDSEFYKEGMIHFTNEIMSIHRFRVSGMKYDFVYHILANRSSLLSSYLEWRKVSIIIIIFVVMLFALSAFYLMNKQLKTLRSLTERLKRFPMDRQISKLPTNRKDEIGELAKGFEEMAGILNNHIDRIEQEKTKAERAEKDKSDFIENISHEIRNPLQSVMGLTSMLVQNNPRPDQQDILNSVRLNTTNLHSLVQSILDYQKGIKGELKQEFVWTPIRGFIENVAIGAKHLAAQKDITIEAEIDDEFQGVEARIDKLRLSQILHNLIGNSISNSPRNSNIYIHVKCASKEANTVSMEFAIQDTGYGMSEEEMAKISDRYYTNVTNKSSHGNYGLGLTIVRELLLLMNSSMKIESEKNKGSTFSFVIGADYRDSETSKSISTRLILNPNDKVLIVEDDEQVKMYYNHLFVNQRVTYLESFEYIGVSHFNFELVISDNRIGELRFGSYLDQFSKVLSETGLILLVSGDQVNIDQYLSVLPNLQFLQKPIQKSAFIEAINKGIIVNRFGVPALEVIQEDYDHDRSKYEPAINLLLKEWGKYRTRLINSIENQDEAEWNAILHKLDNTLRRLKLLKLEAYLNEVMRYLKNKETTIEKEVHSIGVIMDVYRKLIERSIR